MKRGLKDIEHTGYSAPGGGTRDFIQRAPKRRAAPSIARRYAPHACVFASTFQDHDARVRKLMAEGIRHPAKRARVELRVKQAGLRTPRERNRARP